MVEESLQCYDIEDEIAISQYWCVNHQPEDPICNNYVTCVDQTEQRSLACTEPHTTGIVNQARYYTCASDAWSDWVDTASNCIQDPPTCIESVEERKLECDPGSEGLLIEQKISTCSSPYSEPQTGGWLPVLNTCKLKATNPTSIESPLNPVSPLNTQASPIKVEVPKPIIPMQDPIELENIAPPVETEKVEKKPQTKVETAKSLPSTNKEEKVVKEEAPKTKKNEEVVPGFGIAISFSLLAQPSNIYTQPLDEYIGIEDDYAAEQNILFGFIQSDDIRDNFNSLAIDRWDSILRHNDLQRYGFGD